MKRTQRNLSLIITTIAIFYLILIRLPVAYALGVAVALIVIAVALVIIGRDFMIGRYRARRREWERALTRFQRFEKKLLKSPWRRVLMPLYLSMYSFDGVAVARNNIGIALMHLRELDQAEQSLRSALQRDPLYPLPYLNLGVIAATRRQPDVAEREIRKAVQLGYSPTGAQQLLRRALSEANSESGGPMK